MHTHFARRLSPSGRTAAHLSAAAVVCSLCAVLLGLSAACSGGTTDGPNGAGSPGHCVRNTLAGGCLCTSYEQDVNANYEVVDTCDPAPGSSCCYDVDSAGSTESCQCSVARCYQEIHSRRCHCGYYLAPPGGIGTDVEEVDSCASDGANECCLKGDVCFCHAGINIETCGDYEVVAACSKPTSRVCDPLKTASSCNGLDFGG